jgi:hypothetical protein
MNLLTIFITIHTTLAHLEPNHLHGSFKIKYLIAELQSIQLIK